MPWGFKSIFSSILTPNASTTDLTGGNSFHKAIKSALFPKTNPVVDGDDCNHDCSSCTIKYPSKFSINESEDMFGQIKAFNRHIIVATGKSDWVRDVADEKGSVMEAVSKHGAKHNDGKLMLSASNIPVPDKPEVEGATSCLLLPAFKMVDNVTPESTADLMTHIINTSSTNMSTLNSLPFDDPTISLPPELNLKTRECPHDYLILLCSQKSRDARCGQSAPLLRREFERHLRPLGLYRDLHDERPGGVGIYFISHVGGHKFSANVLIYRKAGTVGANPFINAAPITPEMSDDEQETTGKAVQLPVKPACREAAQCIWLARVRPEDCENIVKYTVLQGKVVKPERQLRGGFDRGKQLVSW